MTGNGRPISPGLAVTGITALLLEMMLCPFRGYSDLNHGTSRKQRGEFKVRTTSRLASSLTTARFANARPFWQEAERSLSPAPRERGIYEIQKNIAPESRTRGYASAAF